MSAPRVSVVIPAHDAAITLPALFAGLSTQAAPAGGVETILVDSGSRDETAAIGAAAGARVVEATHPGAAAARNAGIRATRGELVVFLDSDCIPRPEWLRRLVAPLEGSPELGAVGGRVVAAASQSLLQRHAERQRYVSQETAFADPHMPYVLTASCCYRRKVLERLEGFHEDLRSAEDVDLAWRMQRELGLRALYVGDATVEHVHRSTVRGIWRQWVRYGWGEVQLRARYPEVFATSPLPSGSGRSLTWVARRAERTGREAVRFALGRGDRLDVVAPALEALERVAERVGRRQAMRAERDGRRR